jgi:predicted phage baseplate assembly protein
MTVGSLGGAPAAGLGPSIEVLFNLFQVTRGETVANEVLGTGNAAVASQDFILKKAPVTYFADPASSSGDQFSSSVRAWINGLEWMEVPSFFGRAANAEIFVTREDEAGKTHVVFGDGQNGASLPTGAVVTATYRIGSGATAPAAGALTNILKPRPGLKAVANPVPPVGGADPDPPAKVRTLAPRSVLTFGRAVSLDDYRVIAASAPGVVKAEAAYSFDPIAQRPAVTVWVAGDAGAPAAAAAAIAATADPNRPVKVLAATGLDTSISLTYVRDPRRADDTLRQGLHAALLDPDKGLFGVNVIGIGEAVFDSQIYAACLAVTGVVAVEGLAVRTGPRFRPFFGRRFVFRGRTPVGVAIPCTGERHDPGEGRFLSVPDDGAHLTLAGRVAS